MINKLINKGNVNEQLNKSVGYFIFPLINTNRLGLTYCEVFFIHYN